MTATAHNGCAIREASILGCLLTECPDTLPPGVARLIQHAPDAFDDQRHGGVAVAIRALLNSGVPVHVQTVAEKLNGTLDSIGGMAFLLALAADGVPVSVAEFETEAVWTSYTSRRTVTTLDEGAKALLAAPEQRESIARHVREALDELDGERDGLAARLEARQFRFNVKPPPIAPRYFVGDIPISTPGNLTSLSAHIKTAKSSVGAAMMSAAMTKPDSGANCLGFRSSNPAGLALVKLDTEQSIEDHDSLDRQAIRRAKLTEPPPWLLSYCITGFSVRDAQEALRQVLRHGKDQFGGIHSVLLDGVGDMVPDVNDAESCNAFVAELHALAIDYTCPIIGVIHLNPGTEKTRGHLGSQLERKAESNLRLERDGDAIVLWSDKNRKAPISKDRGPRFVWSLEAGMFVTTETAGTVRDSAKRAELFTEAEVVFQEAKRSSLSWREFHVLLEQNVRLKPGTARKHFAEMLRTFVITKNLVGNYELAQTTS